MACSHLDYTAGIGARAAESRCIMSQPTRVQLHYPLERIKEPVITRLVTDFDLVPNILQADVDAQKGGWLVVELTGDDERIALAIAWMREQGLEVDEAS
jgi:ABC-type methionine transport system ATPase subunit